MKIYKVFFKYMLFLGAGLFTMGCEPDEQNPKDVYEENDGFKISLAADRALGKGQYRQRAEMYRDTLRIDVQIVAPSELAELKITKTINLETDERYGTNGTMVVDASGTSFNYEFVYPPDTSDVDQLVGFTFEAVTLNGDSEISDLTAVVTLNPRDNITRKRWNLTSIKHVNNNNEEVIKECEANNSMLLNADSTMVMDYGPDQGAPGCDFDGFNIYTKWYFTDDHQKFVQEYYGLFDPTPKADTFAVATFTVEALALEQTVDLTELGLGVETFLYLYEAGPK